MESLRREIVQYLKEVLACRLCRNVALLVLSSILLIEGAILVPSYRNYERDLLVRLAQVGGAVVGGAVVAGAVVAGAVVAGAVVAGAVVG